MKAGLIVKSNTIIGFPGETHLDVWKTLWWLSSITIRGVHDATISIYIPYPESEIISDAHELMAQIETNPEDPVDFRPRLRTQDDP